MQAPHDAERVQLVFSGECVAGHDPQEVREAVVRALKLEGPRADRLFSGQRVVLRRAVDVGTAQRYIVRFAILGAVVRAEPVQPRPAPAAAASPALASAAPTESPVAAAAPMWALVLRWIGLGAAVSLCAVLLGLLLGPGLSALWPEASPADAASMSAAAPEARVASPSAGTIADLPTGAVSGEGAEPAGGPAQADGELPSEMTPDAVREYRQSYLPARGHKAFAVSPAKAHAWHAGAPSGNAAREAALTRCMEALRPGDEGCRIVDADGVLLE